MTKTIRRSLLERFDVIVAPSINVQTYLLTYLQTQRTIMLVAVWL